MTRSALSLGASALCLPPLCSLSSGCPVGLGFATVVFFLYFLSLQVQENIAFWCLKYQWCASFTFLPFYVSNFSTLNQECFFSSFRKLSALQDLIAALSLTVAMNEAVASLVSSTGIEHREEIQGRTGNFIPTKSQTGHPLAKPLLTPVFTPCISSWERMEEQSSIQATWGWKQKGKEGFL